MPLPEYPAPPKVPIGDTGTSGRLGSWSTTYRLYRNIRQPPPEHPVSPEHPTAAIGTSGRSEQPAFLGALLVWLFASTSLLVILVAAHTLNLL